MGIDTHIVMTPSPGGPVPTPMPMPFNGPLSRSLSANVLVEDQPAAMEGSGADNMPPHIPTGGPFQSPPSNKATVKVGSATVFINDRAAAHLGSQAETCNDPADAPVGFVIAMSSVFLG